MSSLPAIQFNEPPVTKYNSMDVDDSSESWVSLDGLYLGPDDDIEYDSVSSGLLDVLAAIPTDHPAPPINPDLYLRPDDDLIDCDEGPDSADADSDAPAAAEVSMSSWAETSDKLKRADTDLQRLQRAEWLSIEMLKVVLTNGSITAFFPHTFFGSGLTGQGFGIERGTAVPSCADEGPGALLGLLCRDLPSAVLWETTLQ
ncbi:hypothetical protein EDB19DRAFT_1914519 [Suillus lakei]|nr:hypothetical protein EDB19DRAFT_1914519 [Suillus lakei]